MNAKLLLCMTALLAAGFAGCVDTGESTPAGNDAPAVAAGPASFDETTGAIEGLVTTEDLAPVPGATVGLLESQNQTTTDPEGRFVFNHITPGAYTVAVQALGFESQAKKIDVQAGASTPVQFALTTAAVEEAFAFVDVRKATITAAMYRASPQCIYTEVNPLVKTCGGARPGCEPADACEVHYAEFLLNNTDWKTMTGEVSWQPQSGATGRGFLFDINAPNITRGTGGSINQADPKTWNQMAGQSPIVIRIDNPTSLEERAIPPEDWLPASDCDPSETNNCDWFYRLFAAYCDLSSTMGDCGAAPVDYGIAVDSTATIYYSIFILEPAPVEYSALPDE